MYPQLPQVVLCSASIYAYRHELSFACYQFSILNYKKKSSFLGFLEYFSVEKTKCNKNFLPFRISPMQACGVLRPNSHVLQTGRKFILVACDTKHQKMNPSFDSNYLYCSLPARRINYRRLRSKANWCECHSTHQRGLIAHARQEKEHCSNCCEHND